MKFGLGRPKQTIAQLDQQVRAEFDSAMKRAQPPTESQRTWALPLPEVPNLGVPTRRPASQGPRRRARLIFENVDEEGADTPTDRDDSEVGPAPAPAPAQARPVRRRPSTAAPPAAAPRRRPSAATPPAAAPRPTRAAAPRQPRDGSGGNTRPGSGNRTRRPS